MSKKLKYKITAKKFEFELDSNLDGQPSIKGYIDLPEGLAETIQRGEAIEGVKAIEYKVSLGKALISLDSDKDGEKSAEVEFDFMEILDEAKDQFFGRNQEEVAKPVISEGSSEESESGEDKSE